MDAVEHDSRISELLNVEVELMQTLTPRSRELCRRAVDQGRMPLGVPTNVCSLWPLPITMRHGAGAYLTDADDRVYTDFSAGYGSIPFGHANPAIVAALQAQAAKGTHFGALTEPVIDYATHVCDRFGLDYVRFSNSGTEATMDALRLARAHTRRPIIVKAEGAYHGSYPEALNSINQPPTDMAGPDDAPHAVPGDDSIPARVTDQDIRVVPFNDLAATRRALADLQVAALIIEPVMFNVGFIAPEPGYLQGLRELCDETGTVLVFDEVKTGATIAYGGAEEVYGVRPDIKCFAKTVAGGLPGGCFGGTDDSMFSVLEESRMMHVGTFSGNPLTSAAGLAALTEVLTPDAYRHLQALNDRMRSGLDDVIARHNLAAYTVGMGAKGCLVWADAADGPLRDFRDYWRRFDKPLADLAWVYLVNRGQWLAPGHDEQFTLSVAHTNADVDGFVARFEEFGALLEHNGLAQRS